ncbi:MAG TPA: endonuclease [Arcobacter sp.]|nr:endonuclease [Arcobacter sp.]HIP55904.1 endonuclease [Arcobacter sp.]
MKSLIISLILVINLFAAEDVYFLPKQSKEAKSEILSLIDNAKSNIDIAMYNFKHRKFAKALGNAAKRGVEVKLYYYKKKVTLDKKIKAIKVKTKLHTKIAIFDKKRVVFGSLNWTKDSFKKNYEVMYVTDKKDIVEEFNEFFKTIKRR